MKNRWYLKCFKSSEFSWNVTENINCKSCEVACFCLMQIGHISKNDSVSQSTSKFGRFVLRNNLLELWLYLSNILNRRQTVLPYFQTEYWTSLGKRWVNIFSIYRLPAFLGKLLLLRCTSKLNSLDSFWNSLISTINAETLPYNLSRKNKSLLTCIFVTKILYNVCSFCCSCIFKKKECGSYFRLTLSDTHFYYSCFEQVN